MVGGLSAPATGSAAVRLGVAIALSLLLVACNDGSSSGAVQGLSQDTTGVIPSDIQSPETFFASSVQPALENCRLCHVQGGPADVVDGEALQLHASNKNEDYARVFSAWQNLSQGVLNNRLLTMPSDSALKHSGSTPWPLNSQSFLAMKTLLSCWDNPAPAS